jgi:hypothetical protein
MSDIIFLTSNGEISVEEFLLQEEKVMNRLNEELEETKQSAEKFMKKRFKLEETKVRLDFHKNNFLEKVKLLREQHSTDKTSTGKILVEAKKLKI